MKFVILLVAVTTAYASPKNLQTKNGHFKVDDGTVAKLGEVSFAASVQTCSPMCEAICGGVIIHENWVLTAGQYASQATLVIVGSVHLNEQETGKQTLFVDKIVIHPDYKEGENGPNDIALLRLKDPIKFNEIVSPAKLPEQGEEFTGTADLAGYGLSSILKIAKDLPVLTFADCKKALVDLHHSSADQLDEKSNICNGDLNKSANLCRGDAGGPLFQKDVVIGIATWYVTPCNYHGAPNIFTKVSAFVDWINENISK